MHGIESSIIDFVRSLFDSLSWFGIVIAMAIESACIPLPSEIIMPLAGWLLVAENGYGWGGIIFASFCGALGNLICSAIAYYVGWKLGRPFIERYGKWILITSKDLDRADRWFKEQGEITTLVSRVLPVVRTFISLPAGIARMNFPKFALYTFVGAFIWCIPLTWIGYHLGPKWEDFRNGARFADYPIALLILAAIAFFVWHRVREIRRDEALRAQALADSHASD